MSQTLTKRIITLVILCAGINVAFAIDLRLAIDGITSYGIVKPRDSSPVDEYAVKKLALYLEEITGATFPVVEPTGLKKDQNGIFVGLSDPACTILGADPLSGMEDQEHVARSIGHDIFLYGKGKHGNLWAVMNFLEYSLGWRWYSVHEKPVLPSNPTLTLKPFNRKRNFSFAYREVQQRFGNDFYYQNRINHGYERRDRPQPGTYESKRPSTNFVHTSFSYIPPAPDNHYADRFEWQDKKNYFKTNPEFFTMNESGKRVPDKQLCYSNPALREELTKNIISDIKHARKKGWKEFIVTLDAADTGGKFCHCPGCKALEEKYRSPGGPMYDYLIELCGMLSEGYPEVMVRTLAYRRSQTQYPPVLHKGEMLPRNLIVSFAPIEDTYFADWWNHRDPDIQETYHDLLRWGEITHHLWAWLYPNPWGTGAIMPVGNIERIINNMRLMHYAGVRGVFTDHKGVNQRSGFAELQSYLIFKLMQDVYCDAGEVIREFTDHHYGYAGSLMRKYINELEQGRKEMELPPGVRYKSNYYDAQTFPYLKAENIYRWQRLFDQMENLTTDQPEKLLHVRKERRELDLATLWKWFDVKEKYPGYFQDFKVHEERIRNVYDRMTLKQSRLWPMGTGIPEEFVLQIMGGNIQNAPLPARFENIDRERIRQFVPRQHWRGEPAIIEEPDAAFGYAAPVHKPDLPFNFRFVQRDRAKSSVRRQLEPKDIVAGQYEIYELGIITLTPDCSISFSNLSGQTHLQIGSRLYEPEGDNRWEAYVSLKFEGGKYGGEGDTVRVLCDRIILVKKDGK
jgi:hypothetical protein